VNECPCASVLVGLERKLDQLAAALLTATLLPSASSERTGLLVGWRAIGRYTGRSPRGLRDYAKTMGFPAYRWGAHIYSSPELIERWLVTVEIEKNRVQSRAKQQPPKELGP